MNLLKKSAGYRDGNVVSSWAIAKMTNRAKFIVYVVYHLYGM